MSLRDRPTHGPRAGPSKSPARAGRRAAMRKRQRLIDGFVSSDNMSRRTCTIRDMSSIGSRVEIWSDDASKRLLPGDSVTLYIPSDRKEIDAEVRWYRANVMGLRFTSPFRDPTRPYG
jgi:PilZ domain